MDRRYRPHFLAGLFFLFAPVQAWAIGQGWILRAGPTAEALEPIACVRLAAFNLGVAETIFPGVPPRSFLEFETRLSLPSSGVYRFGLEASGADAVLVLGDGNEIRAQHGRDAGPRRLSGELELEGDISLTLRVQRRVVGPMRVRIFWQRNYDARGGFPIEPIPARATSLPVGLETRDLAGMSLETRALVERKGCTNCHAPGHAAQVVHDREAPVLTGIGTRASVDWMRRWLHSPSSLRHSANMPDLFHDVDEFDVESLLHYLAAQTTQLDIEASPKWKEPSVIAQGKELYHRTGCVACHGALAPLAEVFDDEYLPSTIPETEVPTLFGDLEGKWNPAALASFLMDPSQLYPDDRMPGFDLDAGEASALASYLTSVFGGNYAWSEPVTDRAAHGKEIVSKKRCLNCHALATGSAPEIAADKGQKALRLAPRATPLLELNPLNAEGCLSNSDMQTPNYDLATSDLANLRSFLQQVKTVPKVASPADELQRTLEFLNCGACHSFDGLAGVSEEIDLYFQPDDERTDLGDEGRLPPDLGDAGWRLTTHWLRSVLQQDQRARPFLSARMPNYRSSRAHALPQLFALEQGIFPDADVEPPAVTDELVRVGRDMMGRNAFACFSCHVYKDFPPTGSPGLAIERFAERVRYEWFVPFMSNPQRYRPGSRMPDFATAGVSQFERFLDGDLERQIDALWAYFSLGEHLPPPEELASSGGYQLFVGAKPLVHRGFLEHAGSRGIAVGLPNGLNYSFDAQSLRLVDVWRGSFLNASGSWAGRGGNPLRGRGEVLWEAPEGLALQLGEDIQPDAGRPGKGARFGGYSLDVDGHPTFLYHLAGFDIRERVTLTTGAQVTLERWFEIATEGRSVKFDFLARPETTELFWRADAGEWRKQHGARIDAPPARTIEVKTEAIL